MNFGNTMFKKKAGKTCGVTHGAWWVWCILIGWKNNLSVHQVSSTELTIIYSKVVMSCQVAIVSPNLLKSGFALYNIIFFFRVRAGGNLRFLVIWLAIGAGSIFLSLDHGQRYPDVMSLLCFRGCESLSKKPINTMKIGELPRYTRV